MALKRPTILLILVPLITGCAHYPVNAPLRTVNPRSGYRFQVVAPQTNSDDLLLILGFSGGGTRAAALSYSVLEELKRTQVGSPGNQHPILEDVGLISSVSGGSFTAACYALWGDRIFSDFEPLFLKKHVQTALLLRTLAPWNQVRLASPRFSRSDLAAEYYDHLLQTGASQPVEISTYTIELHFNQLADESDRRFFNSVPTRLQLPPPTVDRLKHLAAVELRRNPEFQTLIHDLGRTDEAPNAKVVSTEAAGSAFFGQQTSEATERHESQD